MAAERGLTAERQGRGGGCGVERRLPGPVGRVVDGPFNLTADVLERRADRVGDPVGKVGPDITPGVFERFHPFLAGEIVDALFKTTPSVTETFTEPRRWRWRSSGRWEVIFAVEEHIVDRSVDLRR